MYNLIGFDLCFRYIQEFGNMLLCDLRYLELIEQSLNQLFKSERYNEQRTDATHRQYSVPSMRRERLSNENGARYALPGDSGDVYCAF